MLIHRHVRSAISVILLVRQHAQPALLVIHARLERAVRPIQHALLASHLILSYPHAYHRVCLLSNLPHLPDQPLPVPVQAHGHVHLKEDAYALSQVVEEVAAHALRYAADDHGGTACRAVAHDRGILNECAAHVLHALVDDRVVGRAYVHNEDVLVRKTKLLAHYVH